MADIFISYAREDQARAEEIAAWLDGLGWSVWWDRRIPLGDHFDDVIEEELDSARCVVVLWSEAARASEWVKTEAHEGHQRNCLIPILIEDVKIPLAYRRLQAANLVGGVEESVSELDRLRSDLIRLLGNAPNLDDLEPDDVLAQLVTDQILIEREQPFGQAELETCATVVEVGLGSPARRLGVARGDVLISIDGEPANMVNGFHDKGRVSRRLELRTVSRGFVTVETAGVDPGFSFFATPQALQMNPFRSMDPDAFHFLWEMGEKGALMALCNTRGFLIHYQDRLQFDAMEDMIEEMQVCAEEWDAKIAAGETWPLMISEPFTGLYVGAAIMEDDRDEGLRLVETFRREEGNYTTNHHAVVRHARAMHLESKDRAQALELLVEAAKLAPKSQRIQGDIKRLGGTPPEPERGWTGRRFPSNYRLPVLHQAGASASLDGALERLERHQLHLVCVLGYYRVNGPYSELMELLGNVFQHMGTFFPSLHVITSNPDKKRPRKDFQELFLEAERRFTEAKLPLTVLFDATDAVPRALNSEGSPHLVAVDSRGIVKADFAGSAGGPEVWTTLHAHLRRHWDEPEEPLPDPMPLVMPRKSLWARLFGS